MIESIQYHYDKKSSCGYHRILLLSWNNLYNATKSSGNKQAGRHSIASVIISACMPFIILFLPKETTKGPIALFVNNA